MVRIDLRNVSKAYGSRQQAVYAVRDLNLSVERGECIALLGPGGSGKTSILRMIAGLEDISAGEIVFDGVRVNEDRAGVDAALVAGRGLVERDGSALADALVPAADALVPPRDARPRGRLRRRRAGRARRR